MPATYTYNDAIEDSKKVVVTAWDEQPYPETHLAVMLSIIGRLDDMKRPSRRKRSHASGDEAK